VGGLIATLEENLMQQKVLTLLEENLLRRAERRAADEGRPLSDLIQDALEKYLIAGLRGGDAVVITSPNEFGKPLRPSGNLVDFFRKSPLAGANLDLARSTDTGRHIDP
jgi:hypothetical protein